MLNTQQKLKYAELRRRATMRARDLMKWDSFTTQSIAWPAKRALEFARQWEGTKPIYAPAKIWSRDVTRPNGNRVFGAHGESACVWIEKPESVGLRFVGLAHDVYPRRIDHTGWYLDPDGWGETVSGVVYQLPARNGRARYLAGYADPWNCDSDGRGPCLLSLDIFEAEPEYCESGFWYDGAEDARHEAAIRADEIARVMAEHEREYQEAWRAGQEARSLASAATDAWRYHAKLRRAFCAAWVQRHAPENGKSKTEYLWFLQDLVARLRETYAEFEAARETARQARDNAPGNAWGDSTAQDAWRNGYREGV